MKILILGVNDKISFSLKFKKLLSTKQVIDYKSIKGFDILSG